MKIIEKSDKMKKISIVIPIYNDEKYISQCLNSIINQTYKNIEIILIDDGSTDNSKNICDEYAKKDKRVKVFHQKNSGVSKARNKGLDNITGDYVMFVDSDDWLEPNACEVLIEKIVNERLDVLIFNFYNEYSAKSVKNKAYTYNIKDDNFINKMQAKVLAPMMKIPDFDVNFIGFTWNKIVSSKAIDNHKFPFENKKAIFEDVIFYYTLFEKTKKIGLCNEYLYHYRIADITTMKNNKDFVSICDNIQNEIRKLSDKHSYDIYYYTSLHIRTILDFCTLMNVYINNKFFNNGLLKKRKLIKFELEKQYYKDAVFGLQNIYLTKRLKIYKFLIKYKLYLLLVFANNIERFLKTNFYYIIKKMNN